MLKVAFPELKIITLPELDQEQCALLICDDPAYSKPGYLVLQDGNPIKAFAPDEGITTIKYELSLWGEFWSISLTPHKQLTLRPHWLG